MARIAPGFTRNHGPTVAKSRPHAKLTETRRTGKGRGPRGAAPRFNRDYHVGWFLRLHEAIRSRDLHLTVVGEDPRPDRGLRCARIGLAPQDNRAPKLRNPGKSAAFSDKTVWM